MTDVLDETHFAMDYADRTKPGTDLPVFHGPVHGTPDTDWVVGPGEDGELVVDRWTGNDPHLFISGVAGSGKSVLVSSMILQMLYNNDPRDVQFTLIDPKTELQFFREAKHVTSYVGLDTEGFAENPRRVLATVLKEVLDEVYRRNKLFVEHPYAPQNLQQARFIARQEIKRAERGETPQGWREGNPFPWWDETEQHPFLMPFHFVVIEECSSFFTAPADDDHRGDWQNVTDYAVEIARIARSAGIHLITTTQHPARQNIPTTILSQSRRIGLPMSKVGSMLTIGKEGLEKLSTPGRGIMTDGVNHKDFKALFFRLVYDLDSDDERESVYGQVPKQ